MGKFIISFFSLLLLLPTFVDADTILPFDTTVSGTLSASNPEDVYTITVPQNGTVKARVNGTDATLVLELRNTENQSVETLHRFYQGGPDDPTWTQPVLLEPGEYHFILKKGQDVVSSEYELRVLYQIAENHEAEPNQTIEEAMPLKINEDQIQGLINWDDQIDFYKIDLPESGRLFINLKSNMSQGGFILYDGNGEYIGWDNPGPSYGAAVVLKNFIDLEAGTYYFRVSGWEWAQGLYTISATFSPSNTKEAEPNNSLGSSINLPAGETYLGFLSWSDKDDFYKFEMPYDGFVTLKYSSEFGSYFFMRGEMESMPASHYSVGQPGKPESISKRIYLNRGTYYFQSHNYNQGGTYTVSIHLEPELGMNFSDVSSNYLPAVRYLLNQEVTSGLTQNTFGTTKNIKRVDASIWLAKILKLDTSDETAPSFIDTPKRSWGSINALKKAGIVSGKSNVYYGANDNVTRGEMALMIQRAYQLYGNKVEMPYIDVSPRYESAVQNLLLHRITSGKTSTTFGTNIPITRGEMALFLYRADLIQTK